jgi:hypothetical protein
MDALRFERGERRRDDHERLVRQRALAVLDTPERLRGRSEEPEGHQDEGGEAGTTLEDFDGGDGP